MTANETAILLMGNLQLANKWNKHSPPELLDVDQKTLEFYQSWFSTFGYWKDIAGFVPVDLVASEDFSEPYEQENMLVFLLVSGQYATVRESGCSCYDPSWSEIELHKDENTAMEMFNEYCSQQRRS